MRTDTKQMGAALGIDFLSTAEVAAMVGVSPQKIGAWRFERRFPRGLRDGNRVFTNRADVVAWLDARRVDVRRRESA